MLDVLDNLTLLQYSPRGQGEISIKSKATKDSIKAGRISGWGNRLSEIIQANQQLVADFLNPDVTLIPVPRSSITKDTDLWPSLEICKLLASINCGTVAPCLIRQQTIRKSALSYSADKRPSIAEQYESMAVENYLPTENITIVDDVLTLGRTSVACASRLAERFPIATIRSFALIRTVGYHNPEIEKILNVIRGTITYNPASGKCNRDPF